MPGRLRHSRLITVDYDFIDVVSLNASYKVALQAGLYPITRMTKKGYKRIELIDGMGRRQQGRMTVLEAVMRQSERKRGHFRRFLGGFG